MTVEIKGLEELMKKVKTLEDLEGVKAGMRAGADQIKGEIAKYPPVRRYKAQFISDKQRRFFFAALKDGRIEVPYRRGSSPGSEDHANSWTIKETNGGLTQRIGSDTSYGSLLQEEGKQAYQHKLTGWKTTERIAIHEGPKVVRLIIKEVDRLLEK